MNNIQRKAIKKLIEKINNGELFIDDSSRIYKKMKDGTIKHIEYLNQGYFKVGIRIESKTTYVSSHRLLYAYYHGIHNLKPGLDIHHKDYNRINNTIKNLEAMSKRRNIRDEHINKNKTNVKIGLFIMEREIDREYIIKELEITQNTLSNWCTGKTYPTMDKAYILADLLGVKVDDLYERKKTSPD